MSSPIGLDLGARTPEETAVSIAAEIIALRWGGSGQRLAELDGRIHESAAHPDVAPAGQQDEQPTAAEVPAG
jgi:xanthine dehydrogenase accessory factor